MEETFTELKMFKSFQSIHLGYLRSNWHYKQCLWEHQNEVSLINQKKVAANGLRKIAVIQSEK